MSVTQIHPLDNVAVALTPVAAGERILVGDRAVTALADIPQGHKMALCELHPGECVVKYGYPIGRALAHIVPGQWVHTHNLGTGLDRARSVDTAQKSAAPVTRPAPVFFGYRRPGGGVGIRNEVWIVPTVGCVNGVAQTLARRMSQYAAGRVDGVFAWPHPYGCSQMGDDQENTRRILCGLIRHPNAGAVLVLGLGCENSGVAVLREQLGTWDRERVAFLECQSVSDELTAGETCLTRLIDCAAKAKRETVSAGELVVGLKCGGSDGLSGLTANPLVGRVSDALVTMGGATLLAEVPELFGAEPVLFRRCADGDTAEALKRLVEEFKDYFIRYGQVVYENPSPGNKAGGITTLEEKSLGCVQKGGSAPVVDVLRYGAVVRRSGLTVLETPGNDLVSTTALAAAGAHLILFTTGRGTPFGAPVPTLKIATNSALTAAKPGWIDYDAGSLAAGADMEEHTQALLRVVLAVAGGAVTRSEAAGYREIAIFKNGVTL